MTFGTPDSAGVPYGCAKDTLTAVYNDADSAEELLRVYPDSVACVIVEPAAANMGLITPEDGFLERLRELCDK